MLATVVQPMRVHTSDTGKSWRGGGKQKSCRGMGGLASNGRKFLLLLWKNWLLQRRNVLQTIAELVLPIVFCVVLVVIRGLAPSDVYPEPTTFPTFSLNKLPADLTPPTSDGLLEAVMKTFLGANAPRTRRSLAPEEGRTALLSRVKRQSFLDNVWGLLGADDLYWPVAYTPNTTEHGAIMKIVSDRLYPDIEVFGFSTEEEMVDQLTALAMTDNQSLSSGAFSGEDYLAGIVFMTDLPAPDLVQVPLKFEYKIRMKGSLRNNKKQLPFAPPPQWVTELVYPLFQVPGPRERNSTNGPKPGYYDEGYLSLQHAIDMAIAQHYSGGQAPNVEVEMGRMPYPPYVDDKYLVALQAWLPLILLLSYLYPAVNIVKNVVHEKEKKLKESMKMMGLPNYLHWAAWFVKSLVFLTVTTLLITLLLCTKWQGAGSLAVLHNSDPSLVFCFLCVYLVTVISFCFMLSTLFSKANIAATVTGLLWIFSYLPNEFLRPRYGYIGASYKLVLCFFFKIALGYGCQLMSMFEGTGSGAQWDLLFEGVSPDDPLTLGHVMLVMMLDAVVYALLAWYIEAVFPGEFGVPQPWNFLFLRSYWLGVEETAYKVPLSSSQGACLPDPDFFETDPVGQQIGIQIKGLTKVFPRGNKVAVSKMHLNMYSNQMTVLLGHNGAGKTTTMSMLTGLFPPTSGTALVNGYDIVKEMREVRRSIGICPQHDVLFDELTVAEHIEFFSVLKGLPRDKVASEIQSIVAALKLEDKVLAQSRTLSGGMKRKLSVGIALCAGSRVVILDEPTSGMDPGARRLIWDLLQKEKQGRTLLLTTHFMEEADLLGDRIAIMALGVVQCCGSSMFLKKRYGSGYHLVIVKQEACDVSAVTATIQKYIRDARLDQNHGAELSYVLPNEDVAKFEQLFNEIEERREELKISSYGASQTTMDEVFLRVGENAEQREQLRQYSAEAAAAGTSTQADDRPDAVELQAPASPLNGAMLNSESGRSSGAKHHARTGSSVSVNSMKMQLMREIEEQAARDIAMKPEKGALLQHQHPGDDIEETVLSFDAPDPRRPSASGSVMQKVLAAAVSISSIASASEVRRRRVPARRNTGPRLLAQHFWAMLVKKTLYVMRNRVISIVQVLIPVVFLILAILIVRTLPGAIDSPPPLWASFGPYRGTVTPLQEYTVSNESAALTGALRGLLTGADITIDPQLGSGDTMVDYLLKQSAADLPSFHLSWMMAVEVTGRADSSTLVSVLFNGKPYHVPTAALNIIDNAVVRAHTGQTDLQIETINHPLPRTDTDKLTQDSRQNLGFNIGFNLAFSLSFLSGSLVMFLVRERSSNAKHLQFVSGVNFVTYWLATAIVDFCIYLVPYFLIVVCLKVFNEEGMREPSQLGLILLVLVLYSWAMAPLMYLASFFFTVPSSGFTRMSILNVFVGMATLITVTMLRIPDLELQHIADLLDWVFLLLPPYAMASSLTDLYTNFRSRQICDRPAIEMSCGWGSIFANPCCKANENCGDYGCVLWQSNMVAWEKLGIGRMLVFLAVEGLIFYILIALVELKVFQSANYFFAKVKQKIINGNSTFASTWTSGGLRGRDAELEEDVRREATRIQTAPTESLFKTDILVFKDLTKRYGNSHLAVDHLNLGVPPGECFGLLGINGAGKTTTFKMLTGDLTVTSGEAYVNGYSITNQIKKVQQEVGYCPQFDAILDQMTGRETLRMFARLRGVPESCIDEQITDLAQQLIVTPHLDNLVGNYSGGNKRKISTGIALIGEPPLVLLDEPTSGMDPVARRHLWDVLNSARDAGRSIVLTSHSMEECEALCTRLAIMTNGRFRCLGSPQHLKNKFSEGYSLTVRVAVAGHQEADHMDVDQLPPEMLKLQRFIAETFPDSEVREVQWGRLEYFIAKADVTWADVFGTLERNKSALCITDYSVTQTTLERVFLNFTRAQGMPELQS